jgi:hypothetical protein
VLWFHLLLPPPNTVFQKLYLWLSFESSNSNNTCISSFLISP